MSSKYAYVTLVMLGDNYVPGAIVLGHSLRQVSPSIDRVVMVSEVSEEAIIQLEKLWIVQEVPLLTFKSKPFLITNPKQKKRYASWMNSSYTKWQSLNLTNYDKIFFLDADTIVLKNIDAVFQLPTPAGVFANPWITGSYNRLWPGKLIHNKDIDRAFSLKGSVVVANSILLSPSTEDYKGVINMVRNQQPFGFKVYSANDEQAISKYYYTINKQWTVLPFALNTIPWYLNLVNPLAIVDDRKERNAKLSANDILMSDIPLVIHYFGDTKVWDMDPHDPKIWPDIYAWWTLALNYIQLKTHTAQERTLLQNMFKVRNVQTLPKKCFYCSYLKLDDDHHMFDTNSKLSCPQL